MEYTHHYFLSIPLNVRDLNVLEEEISWEDIKFEEFEIDSNDYNNLFDLFCQYDKPFDILIDEYEEEIIPASGVQLAIEMAERYAAGATPEVKASIEKLLAVLRRAKELGKQVLLSF